MEVFKAYEAEGRPRATIYEFLNGRKEKWIGGSPAWRNSNPGNLRPAKAHPGQIGEACRCWAEPVPETTLQEVFKK